MTRLLAPFVAVALLMTHADSAAAQTAAEPLRYTLSFPAPQTHYLEVSAAVPTDRRPEVELMMAVWTPGSYLVREYERNVEAVTAAGSDGRALAVVKSDKNRWRITTGGAATVTVKYRVYAREMSVRTNWVEAGFALVNGAPTFLTLADRTPRAHEVVLGEAGLAHALLRELDGAADVAALAHEAEILVALAMVDGGGEARPRRVRPLARLEAPRREVAVVARDGAATREVPGDAPARLELLEVLAPRDHRVGLVEPDGRLDRAPEPFDVRLAEHGARPAFVRERDDRPVAAAASC